MDALAVPQAELAARGKAKEFPVSKSISPNGTEINNHILRGFDRTIRND
jgi:hypothetical protein